MLTRVYTEMEVKKKPNIQVTGISFLLDDKTKLKGEQCSRSRYLLK